MAKRKVPAALFEVIHTAPPPPLKFSKPKRTWWFGQRSDEASHAEMLRSLHPSMIADEPGRSAGAGTASRSPEAELRARFAEAEAAHEVAVFSADEPEGLEMEDEPGDCAARQSVQAPLPPLTPISRTPTHTAEVSEFCGGGLRVDRGRQELTFRLGYTTAALAAFIVVVLLGLAFVVGKRIADRSDDDQAMAALRASSPNPSVMSVDHTSNSAGRTSSPDVQVSASERPREVAPSPADPAAGGPVQRTIGLDYLVVQSYPDRKSAQEAADLLSAGGVACTVEHGLKWAPNWFSVITATGFPPHSADADRLADSIRKIAARANRETGHHYKFDPQKYQWNQ